MRPIIWLAEESKCKETHHVMKYTKLGEFDPPSQYTKVNFRSKDRKKEKKDKTTY